MMPFLPERSFGVLSVVMAHVPPALCFFVFLSLSLSLSLSIFKVSFLMFAFVSFLASLSCV